MPKRTFFAKPTSVPISSQVSVRRIINPAGLKVPTTWDSVPKRKYGDSGWSVLYPVIVPGLAQGHWRIDTINADRLGAMFAYALVRLTEIMNPTSQDAAALEVVMRQKFPRPVDLIRTMTYASALDEYDAPEMYLFRLRQSRDVVAMFNAL